MSKIESSIYLNVVAILGCEFCERFAYYSIASSLTLYLRSNFGYSTDKAAICYTLWRAFATLFSVFGGYISDRYWGKKKTIIIGAIIYTCSLSVVSILTIVIDFAPDYLSITATEIIVWFALYCMKIGGSGIRSSVGLLGEAQLRAAANPVLSDEEDVSETADGAHLESKGESEVQRIIESYWSWFYFALTAGALISYSGISYLLRTIPQLPWKIIITESPFNSGARYCTPSLDDMAIQRAHQILFHFIMRTELVNA